MGIVSGVLRQFGVAADALKALLSAPQMLVYPILVVVLYPLLMGGVLGGFYALGVGLVLYIVGMVILFLGGAALFGTLMTAYCYEVNEVFQGRSPAPLSGLRVAVGRFKLVIIAAVVVAGGEFASQGARGSSIPFSNVVGATSAWGFKIASVFAFPAVATTQGSLRDTFTQVKDAIKAEWGKSIVATVSTRLIGMSIAWAGILGGIGLAIAAFTDTFAVDAGPLGPFTLPIVVAVTGIVLAIVVQFTISGLLKMALYRYAVDGELPPALSTDADVLVETDDAGA